MMVSSRGVTMEIKSLGTFHCGKCDECEDIYDTDMYELKIGLDTISLCFGCLYKLVEELNLKYNK